MKIFTKIRVFFPFLSNTKIRFLGHEVYQGTIRLIQRSIKFDNKFLNKVKDKNQLQRFLGSLNHVSNFYLNLRKIVNSLLVDLRTTLILGLLPIQR